MKSLTANGGFTLIELLVSSAIIGIVMMVLLSVTSTGLQLWNSSESGISVDAEGRGAQAILAMDMQGAFLPRDANLWPQVDAGTNAAVPLRFLTLLPADYQDGSTDTGDVCYVEYRFDAAKRTLLRGFAGSKATYDALPGFPSVNNFEVLATNVPQIKFWAWDSVGNPANGLPPSSIEARIEVLDRQEIQNMDVAEKRGYRSRRYYFSRFALPPPLQ